jgi:hypothetical protein
MNGDNIFKIVLLIGIVSFFMALIGFGLETYRSGSKQQQSGRKKNDKRKTFGQK